MGYNTYFYGEITLPIHYSELLRWMVKNEVEPLKDFFSCVDDGKNLFLTIDGGFKDYADGVLRACLFIARLDNLAKGDIVCEGEERDDNWKIRIEGGSVIKMEGKIIYNDEQDFEDEKIIEKLYEVTKEKRFLNECVLNKL